MFEIGQGKLKGPAPFWHVFQKHFRSETSQPGEVHKALQSQDMEPGRWAVSSGKPLSLAEPPPLPCKQGFSLWMRGEKLAEVPGHRGQAEAWPLHKVPGAPVFSSLHTQHRSVHTHPPAFSGFPWLEPLKTSQNWATSQGFLKSPASCRGLSRA